ncbi:MAG: acyl-CoA dehydrogenase family protein, partial [Deltaproteobacteria bacterium]|nr:acyl-CoA dehydrogenase family protein [Deltaproteobacteria bacterium]
MDFELTKEIAAVLKEARRFACKEVLPRVNEEGFKRDLVSKMGQLGLFGCAFPLKYGGSDLCFLAHTVVCEELS